MNPFLTKGYISPKYFCDRDIETQNIIEAMENNRDIILYGRRKLGKTALIHHVLHKLSKRTISIWIDLLPTQSLQDLINTTANQILNTFEEQSNIGIKLWKGIKTLRPNINYDTMTGLPSVSFVNQSTEGLKNTFTEIIKMLQSASKKVVIAFDEFQQITEYPEENVESFLRTLIQASPKLSIIYSGSDQTLLEHMFDNINQPFYQSGQRMKLGPIESQEYICFIQEHFADAKKTISDEDTREIIEWCSNRTLNIQILCNRLFASRKKKIRNEDIQGVKASILGELDDMYYMMRKMMTRHQWKVVQSIAKAGSVYEPYGHDFMKTYKFTNPSTIRRTIQKFTDQGLLFHGSDTKGDFLEIDDVFMQKWILNTIL